MWGSGCGGEAVGPGDKEVRCHIQGERQRGHGCRRGAFEPALVRGDGGRCLLDLAGQGVLPQTCQLAGQGQTATVEEGSDVVQPIIHASPIARGPSWPRAGRRTRTSASSTTAPAEPTGSIDRRGALRPSVGPGPVSMFTRQTHASPRSTFQRIRRRKSSNSTVVG